MEPLVSVVASAENEASKKVVPKPSLTYHEVPQF
jgi:hypothetical protein